LDFKKKPKRDGAGEDTDEGKTRSINIRKFQRQPAEEGIARERDHREEGEEEETGRGHRINALRSTSSAENVI
jgi:hypothetical protein